jgi:hypothetical protein
MNSEVHIDAEDVVLADDIHSTDHDENGSLLSGDQQHEEHPSSASGKGRRSSFSAIVLNDDVITSPQVTHPHVAAGGDEAGLASTALTCPLALFLSLSLFRALSLSSTSSMTPSGLLIEYKYVCMIESVTYHILFFFLEFYLLVGCLWAADSRFRVKMHQKGSFSLYRARTGPYPPR